MRTKLKRGTALMLALLGATALAGATASRAFAADDSALNETAAVQQNFTPVGDFTNLVKKVSTCGGVHRCASEARPDL